MNDLSVKMPIGKRTALLGAALFVLGTLAGSLILYGYQNRERSARVHADASRPPQQSTPMPDMPNMPATGAQTPKAQEAKLMPGMPDKNASPNQTQGNQTAPAPPGQSVAPGTVMLDPASQQLIGVRYAEARQTDMKRTLRTVGLIQMDEEKISRVHVKFAGWIQKVYLDYVGKLIKKGEPLFTLYSPELVSTEQEYLIARKGQEYLSKAPYADAASGADSLLRATRDRLQLLDVTDAQIRTLEDTGKAHRTMTVHSPISGFVMSRNAFEQVYVTPETDLYDIADLSTIWVYVDIFEYEAPYVRVGQLGSMQLSYFPGKTYTGRVTFVYPTLDPKTRTIKVRLQFPNPKYELKPEMYAEVQLAIDYGSQVVVPSEAVLNSGTGQFVFIARPGGYFEPREIKVGDQFDGQYVVLAGLKPGEKIVASGNFLIDSESRLGSAMQGMSGMQGKPPTKK